MGSLLTIQRITGMIIEGEQKEKTSASLRLCARYAFMYTLDYEY